jgi:hypothetical protein
LSIKGSTRVNANDICGKKFKRLIPISSFRKDGRIFYNCRCDCGEKLIVARGNLLSHNTLSCGCLKKERIIRSSTKPPGVAAFNALYGKYRISWAKRRGLNFELSKDEFRKLTQGNCFYCGAKPKRDFSKANGKRFYNGSYLYNGIDRINNKKGYTMDNCVTCCYECNKMKGTFGIEFFLNRIGEIYNYHLRGI